MVALTRSGVEQADLEPFSQAGQVRQCQGTWAVAYDPKPCLQVH